MFAIAAGSVALGRQADTSTKSSFIGSALVSLACLCWAIDNNLTRRVSVLDALFVAGIKGVVAGTVNTALAVATYAVLPNLATLTVTMVIGLVGNGISLVRFVLTLRGLGTARTGAYFSMAPFIGATVALFVFSEATSPGFWFTTALTGLGVWLHLTEHHSHEHLHEAQEHEHQHAHDEHHQHTHESGWKEGGQHSHRNQHAIVMHSHPHYPDIHHRHVH